MTLTRRLQFSMAVTASLGSVTLGIAEGNPLLGALAAMAAFTSVYFTDIKGWLVLSTNVANLLGVATLALTLRNWQLVDRELLFISMANLLVYLQCILFYRRKAPRVYWMLLLLSFLQVAVASVLVFSYLFGVLMIVYMFVALRTLALFAIHREQNADRLLGEERGADGRFVSAESTEPAPEPELATEPAVEPAAKTEEGEDPGEAKEATEPLAHMPQDIKDAWGDMPEAAREAVARHQTDMDRKFSQQGRTLQAVQPIADRLNEAIEKYPQFLNMTPDQLAEGAIRLAAVQQDLETDPVNAVLRVAQQYGVIEHLRAALQGEQPSDQANYNTHLQREMREMKTIIEGATGSIEDRISAAMEQRDTASAVQQFAADQPHWADVEPNMPQFIKIAREQAPGASQIEMLKAAYDMAIHAIPDVRAKVEATSKAASRPDPERTEKAKKAASVNLKSTSTGKERVRTELELLSDTYDRLVAD